MTEHIVSPALDDAGDQFWLCSCGAEYTFMEQAITHARKETIRANIALREHGPDETGEAQQEAGDEEAGDDDADLPKADLHYQATRYHTSLVQELGAEAAQAGIVIGILREGIKHQTRQRRKEARRREAAAERARAAEGGAGGVPAGGRR